MQSHQILEKLLYITKEFAFVIIITVMHNTHQDLFQRIAVLHLSLLQRQM